MTWQVHRIGDDGCCGICCGRAVSENGNGIGDAEGETAATPAAGRDATHRLVPVQLNFTEKRWAVREIDHAHDKTFLRCEMQCDVSTVVHIRPRESRGGSHAG